MYDFESAEEIIDYYVKWFGCTKEDFIVIEWWRMQRCFM
jgi:hypothetical protein